MLRVTTAGTKRPQKIAGGNLDAGLTNRFALTPRRKLELLHQLPSNQINPDTHRKRPTG